MFKNPLISITTLFLLLFTTLSGCSKSIKYKEEVKLSDGTMIWVDIERFYMLSSSAVGDGGSFFPSSNNMYYTSHRMEVSWDTGFEGIGRQTLEFDGSIGFALIDKISNTWYIYGTKTRCSPPNGGVYNHKGECWEGEGTRLAHSAYLYAINQQGFIKNKDTKELNNKSIYNILNIEDLDQFTNNGFPIHLKDKSITWQEKLEIKNKRADGSNVIFGKIVSE